MAKRSLSLLALLMLLAFAFSSHGSDVVGAQEGTFPTPPGGFYQALNDVNTRLGTNITLSCGNPSDGASCAMSDVRLNWSWSQSTFPDSGLACAGVPAERVQAVQTRAYTFFFSYGGQDFEYRQLDDGEMFLCTGQGGALQTGPNFDSFNCSTASDRPAYLEVSNNTSRPLDFYWVDYNCDAVYYATVGIGQVFTQQTFVTHIWLVVDSNSSTKLSEFEVSGTSGQIINLTDFSFSCGSAPPPRLLVGVPGQVTPGVPNNVRSAAGTGNTFLFEIGGEQVFDVLEGPVCTQEMFWYRISYNGQQGWMAEGRQGDYWSNPVLAGGGVQPVGYQPPTPLSNYGNGQAITAANIANLVELIELSASAHIESASYGLVALLSPTFDDPQYGVSQSIWLYDTRGRVADPSVIGIQGASVMSMAFAPQFSPSQANPIAFIAIEYVADSGIFLTLRAFDALNGQFLYSVDLPESARLLRYSPDGQTIAVLSGYSMGDNLDNYIGFYNAADGSFIRQIDFPNSYVNNIAYSPDGATLAIARQDGIHLYDTATLNVRTVLQTIPIGFISPLAYTPDGSRLLLGASNDERGSAIEVWDMNTQSRIHRMALQNFPANFAISPDGALLAVADTGLQGITGSESLALWDLNNGTLLRSFAYPNTGIFGLSFSHDGTLLFAFVPQQGEAVKVFGIGQ